MKYVLICFINLHPVYILYGTKIITYFYIMTVDSKREYIIFKQIKDFIK